MNRVKFLVGPVLVLVAAVALGVLMAPAEAVITGSSHDFKANGWAQNQICLPCHAPHNVTTAAKPLWNHAITTQSFTTYTNMAGVTAGQPAGVSKLCLSCHDGTVALDSYGGATGTNFISAARNVGTNLSNDHPVSVAVPGSGYQAVNGTNHTIGTNNLPLNSSDQIECSSCHDVHNGAGVAKLLRVSNTDSALCLSCHVK